MENLFCSSSLSLYLYLLLFWFVFYWNFCECSSGWLRQNFKSFYQLKLCVRLVESWEIVFPYVEISLRMGQVSNLLVFHDKRLNILKWMEYPKSIVYLWNLNQFPAKLPISSSYGNGSHDKTAFPKWFHIYMCVLGLLHAVMFSIFFEAKGFPSAS